MIPTSDAPPIIEVWTDAADYLDELRGTVERDLLPLRRRDQGGCTEGGAPHTITREFSCYVDHLGALYSGSLNSAERFEAYLKDVLGGPYKDKAPLIREMYRNGPVHEFDPKVVFNAGGQTCGWLASVGHSPGSYGFGTDENVELRHLEIAKVPRSANGYVLPVFTSELLEDLLTSIDKFKAGTKIGNLSARVLCWNTAAARLSQPVRFDKFKL